jgi:hypothetical protein
MASGKFWDRFNPYFIAVRACGDSQECNKQKWLTKLL